MLSVKISKQLFSPSQRREIAEKWLQFRRRHYLSQAELARAIGICRRTVIRVERCEHEPQMGTFQKFQELKERYRIARQITSECECDFPPLDKRPADREAARQEFAQDRQERQTHA